MTKKLDPYAELGVEPTADETAIKKAYRKRAKETHPDHKGGSRERFERVNKAMTILKDPEARERYDRTGDTEPRSAQTMEDKARSLLSDIVAGIINGGDDPATVDIVRFMQEYIAKQIADLPVKQRDLESKKTKAEKMAKRFKRKTKGDNLMSRLAESHAQALAMKIASIKGIIEVHEAAAKILIDYKFEYDLPPPQTFATTSPYGYRPGVIFRGI
jgi:curved DNA-binding protein CbpA